MHIKTEPDEDYPKYHEQCINLPKLVNQQKQQQLQHTPLVNDKETINKTIKKEFEFEPG